MITIKEKEQEIDWLNLPYGTLFVDSNNDICMVIYPLRLSLNNCVYAIALNKHENVIACYFSVSVPEYSKNWKLLPKTTLEYKNP